MRLCVKRNLKAYRSRLYVLTELASVVLRDVGSQTIKDPIIVFHSEAIRLHNKGHKRKAIESAIRGLVEKRD